MTAGLPESRKFALAGWIQRGDVAPWRQSGPHQFVFDPVPGRYIVLGFLQTCSDLAGRAALQALHENRRLVDEAKVAYFAIASDPKEKTSHRIEERFSAVRFLWDFDSCFGRAYGVGASRLWIVLNPMLRVVAVIRFEADGSDRRQLFDLLDGLPPPQRFLGLEIAAPILVLSDVFESELCQHLIGLFDESGGRYSGFMEESGGKIVEAYDDHWKRRRDYTVVDAKLLTNLQARIARRIGPEMLKAYHFKMTRIERHLVACYSAEDAGHFGPHRDDTVTATAHRKFAVSINLNDDFDGGELSFSEYNGRGVKAPPGAAVVFSGSLLHCVSQVTRGRRYAFLPFLYDEAGEQMRAASKPLLSPRC